MAVDILWESASLELSGGKKSLEIFGFFIAVVFFGVSRHAVYFQGAVRYVALQKV